MIRGAIIGTNSKGLGLNWTKYALLSSGGMWGIDLVIRSIQGSKTPTWLPTDGLVAESGSHTSFPDKWTRFTSSSSSQFYKEDLNHADLALANGDANPDWLYLDSSFRKKDLKPVTWVRNAIINRATWRAGA